MRLDSRINHERAATAPVLFMRTRVDTVDVHCRVRSGERDPEPVVERSRCELAVIHDDDQWE